VFPRSLTSSSDLVIEDLTEKTSRQRISLGLFSPFENFLIKAVGGEAKVRKIGA
jgi:hypothetical protein